MEDLSHVQTPDLVPLMVSGHRLMGKPGRIAAYKELTRNVPLLLGFTGKGDYLKLWLLAIFKSLFLAGVGWICRLMQELFQPFVFVSVLTF